MQKKSYHKMYYFNEYKNLNKKGIHKGPLGGGVSQILIFADRGGHGGYADLTGV